MRDLRTRHAFATTCLLTALCLAGGAAAQTPATAVPASAPVGGTMGAPKDLSCTQTSNCVNSLSGRGLLPLRFAGDPAQGMALLRATLATYPEAQITHSSPQWLEVIFTTMLGFRDQVDFVVDGQTGHIAFRSRSLLGTYDFGKNRSRMTEFTQRFAAGAR